MRTNRSFALLVLALAATGCGGPLFFAEFEDSRICVTVPRVAVTGLPLGGISVDLPPTDFDVSKAIPYLDTAPDAWTGSLAVTSVSICSGANGSVRCAGTADLTGIDTATLDLRRQDGSATLLSLAYQRPQVFPTPMAIDFVAPQPYVNQLDELKASQGKVQLAGSFFGSPPAADWEADVEVCLQTNMTIDLLKIPR